MIDFDFHNLLFPTEFEKLCRDVVDIRDSPIKFTTYRRGRDGGIDFKSTNTQTKIIGQCKLYNPSNYNSFFANLKNEIKKCKRQKPSRYILCTNTKLSPSQAQEIYDLFEGYIINEEDIVDGEKLNKYLGNKEYQHLLKVYSKLLVPNLQLVEQALDEIINRKYYNKTASFLREIQKEHKLHHNTQMLKHCIDVLEKNKIIILTGNPGVGKTTTAKMIVNYFINQKVKNVLFLTDTDFIEIEGLYQNNQIIVVDDFWGQNFRPEHKDGSRLRNFNRIINDFKESENRYLVLTSREYIIQDVLNHAEHETQKILNTDRFIVNLDGFSNEDKARIFLNHLLYYDFEKAFFNKLEYSDILENIIEHSNYSPRHIEYFIKQFLYFDDKSSYNFYALFLKYLDKPTEYWNKNFEKLNGTSKLILLIILISSDPMELLDLEKSFNTTQEETRLSLNENIEPLAFNKELRILEDFYLVSEKEEYTNRVFLRFQSPGIKDFLLEYLRTNGKAWIKPLLENALFFNQLNFVFDTEEKNIDDYMSEISLFGKKIILSLELQKILKLKLLNEFDVLNFCYQGDKVLYDDAFSSEHVAEQTKYWKLFLLNNLFNISKDENLDVRNFIITEVRKDIDAYEPDKRKIVDMYSMLEFPRVIKLINPYIKLDANYLIKSYFEGCTFTSEFDSLYTFKEIFPFEFESFIQKNNIAIKKAIKYNIIDDIDYYMSNLMDSELDTHLEYIIEEVCKKYKIRLTSKFIKEIEEMAEQRVFSKPKSTKRKPKKKKQPLPKPILRLEPKKFDPIIKEYLPEYSYESFDPIQYLKNIDSDKKLITEIKRTLDKEESILKPFTSNKEVFLFFIQWIEQESVSLASFNKYTLLDSFFTYYCKSNDIDIDFFKKLFFELTEDSFGHDFSLTETQLKKFFIENNIEQYNINILSPIIVTDKKWFDFSNTSFQVYFIAEHLINIKSDEEFKKNIIDYISNINEIELLHFLNYKCKTRLDEVLIISELHKFLSSIDTTSPKTIVLSFLDFFTIHFDIEWVKEEKRFNENSSSCSDWFFEMIIQYLGIDFSTMNFDAYFCKHYYREYNIQKYFINVKAYNKLYNYVIRNMTKRKGGIFIYDRDSIFFDIELEKLAKDEVFYSIIQEIGMEKYILNLFDSIKTAINNY
ncbi:hypothetical protein FF18_15855 [Elizabethkingia anophelis]|uniref:nSTAND3 domain-containing NTPase n=1 Tax=Elizabethkingia anophelis TaxID=1117645 RepID=UPI0004E2E684|nr:ATP-binding protein [Elizabethkingia anophelis]KFC38227.1 hypothetical protein FF18_15855 [Elizabethkingia anophelis]